MELLPLKNIVEFIRTGKTPPTKEIKYFDGDIQWYSPGDLDKGKYLETSKKSITRLAFEDKKAISYPTGTLLVTCIGEIGKLGITNKICSSNQQITAIKPKDNVNVNYLFYWFKKHKKQLQDLANNAVVPILNNRNLGKVEVAFPLLEDQKKIAEILDAADSLRQKDKQLVEHYDRLSQSLFLDMFGDPVANPKQWNISSLKEAGKVSTGNTPPRANLANYGDHIEWIKTTNINTPNMYLTKAEECLSIEGESIGRCVDVNSLLVTCIAGSKKVIGNVAIANRKVAFNQQINSFLPKSGNILFYYYLFVVGKLHVQTFSTDSMKGMINKSKFESIDFISPPVDKQNEFSEAVKLIQEQKELAQRALQKSDDLFNSLLQQAFKGELTNR